MFPIIVPDDLLGQATLPSLDKGEHISATIIPKSIKHNLNYSEGFEEHHLSVTGNHHADKI